MKKTLAVIILMSNTAFAVTTHEQCQIYLKRLNKAVEYLSISNKYVELGMLTESQQMKELKMVWTELKIKENMPHLKNCEKLGMYK